LGGQLTAPVIVGDVVLVADCDGYRLYSLAREDGRVRWTYATGGRIDSPPTMHRGLALCGCRDGWVYALRVEDGQEVWRFRAAPRERHCFSRGRLESAWPVSGSITVVEDTAYFVAGRSSHIDGGLLFFGLDALTGEERLRTRITARRGEAGSQIEDRLGVVGFLPDVLSWDGQHLFMRHQAFDRQGVQIDKPLSHLHAPGGFLDDEWQSRIMWTIAPVHTSTHQGAFFDTALIPSVYPSGQILACDERWVYGYGTKKFRGSHEPWVAGAGVEKDWHLFAAERDLGAVERDPQSLRRRFGKKSRIDYRWSVTTPVRAWALVATADSVFLAGDVVPKARAEATAAMFCAVDKETGTIQRTVPLSAVPRWDAMAVAHGKVFISLQDGSIVCLGSKQEE
jgi:outer membrane protein assembly factor BamB